MAIWGRCVWMRTSRREAGQHVAGHSPFARTIAILQAAFLLPSSTRGCRMNIFRTLLFLVLALAWGSHQVAEAAPRNIVLIVTDDQSPDLGCYGNKIIKTPS